MTPQMLLNYFLVFNLKSLLVTHANPNQISFHSTGLPHIIFTAFFAIPSCVVTVP